MLKNMVKKMPDSLVSYQSFADFSLRHTRPQKIRRPLRSITLETTPRCNNNCRHCYINLPVNDKKAKAAELDFKEIRAIVDEAVALGAFWCLLTGGEPLLRDDFEEIYLYLKKKGLLVVLFTNATLITKKLGRLFKKHPPRDIEVSVYGTDATTYERVTRTPGSYNLFCRGLELLFKNCRNINLKTVALASNQSDFKNITDFCQEKSRAAFRFDPCLNLRFDHDPQKNKTIKTERLSAQKIAELEKKDYSRFRSLKKECDLLIIPEFSNNTYTNLFNCRAGLDECYVNYEGQFRLCADLCHPDCIYDLKKGNLSDAWYNFVPEIRKMESGNKLFLEKCRVCPIINLCMWCPAHAYLETGALDLPVDYFCELARARAELIL